MLLASLSAALVVPMTLNPHALAQCGGSAPTQSVPYLAPRGSLGTGRYTPAAYPMPQADNTAGAAAETDAQALEPIVGLWRVKFAAGGFSDDAYITWHSDHTELMQSNRPPSTGYLCEGVWEKVGPSTYRLNHFARAYTDGVNLTNLYQFQEVVTVSPDGNTYTGSFSLKAFDYKTHATLGQVRGKITGERVRVDSDAESQF